LAILSPTNQSVWSYTGARTLEIQGSYMEPFSIVKAKWYFQPTSGSPIELSDFFTIQLDIDGNFTGNVDIVPSYLPDLENQLYLYIELNQNSNVNVQSELFSFNGGKSYYYYHYFLFYFYVSI